MSEKKTPIIEVLDLSSAFANGSGDLHVLDRINFEVCPAEFVCVLGPSGSGKSTLLRVLAGLLPPTQGEVILEGRRLGGPPSNVGIVFQKSNLMPWRTVLQNITLPLELQSVKDVEAQRRALELVDLVGLQGFESSLPRDLSGGMAQRVAIARALIHDPDVLLLDEPFGALDAITRERMGEELLRIWGVRHKTVVMITHDISEAVFLADRVLVFSDRPARLELDLPVELERPRRTAMRYTPEFGKLARRLREAIGKG